MSEMVHYKGKLHKIEKVNNETLEEQCKRVLDIDELPKYYNTYEEKLLCESEEYITYNGALYSATKENIDLDSDIFLSSEDKNGIINFEVKYYNGGCGFREAIEYALKNKK